MEKYNIGDVAKKMEMQSSAIRYYERVGLLPKAKRLNGRRTYDESIFRRLNFIRLARDAEFGIRELEVLLDENAKLSAQWRTLSAQKIDELDTLIQRAIAIKAWLQGIPQDCECTDIETCTAIPNLDNCVE